ncbi:hypothetical protein [Sphingomonas sp.]|uniref:hypothetical protein n=1 Tax=Sphingomonas sp. TaxID=28214 RepID=UPI002DE7DCC7|nr:hypothetical protein [Sphingomonas sp.]
MSNDNRLIDFLASYGPVATSDSLSDEHVRQAQAAFGMASIETAAPHLEDVRSELIGLPGRNVILTGTAGDGKTYHIRRLIETEFAGQLQAWPGDEYVFDLTLPDGRQLRVIRDLSEISDSRKAAELASFAACLLGERKDRLYLAAANDGQLLKYFRDAAGQGGPEADRYRDLHRRVTEMLRAEAETSDGLSLRLINLSRTWSEATVDAIFDAVLKHPDWDHACAGCPSLSEPNPCPIRLNRELLLDGERPSPFRSRLRQALRLAASNDQHVPVRQLLTLVVNIILGDSKEPNRPLLDCSTAKRRASRREYTFTNPYNNAAGLNLRDDRRRANRVFSVFEVLGTGLETNNLIDSMLVQREPEDLHDLLFASEPLYGADLFDPLRRDYLGGGGGDPAVRNFRRGLEAQRRRAFFRLPEHPQREQASPWRLTIFHHGGEYLELLDALESKRRDVTDRYTKQLVRGLNRALTGMMAADEDRLWLAGTIGKTDDPAGRVSIVDAVDRTSATSLSLKLALDPVTRRPAFGISPPAFFTHAKNMPQLDLRPLLFEYLMRVANGSLPASFSRQCHQEIRHYALVAVAAVRSLVEREPGPEVVRMLALGTHGEIQASRIEI